MLDFPRLRRLLLCFYLLAWHDCFLGLYRLVAPIKILGIMECSGTKEDKAALQLVKRHGLVNLNRRTNYAPSA